MSEIKIDTSGIKKKVNEPLGNAYNDLESARSIISSIKIPSDFYYRDTMRNLPSNIQNQRTRVNTIKGWTEEVVSKFESAETKNSRLMNSVLNNTVSLESSTGAATGTLTESSGDSGSGIFSDILEFFGDIKESIDNVGAKITSAYENSFLKKAVDKVEELYDRTRASVANVVISLAEGIGTFAEDVFKALYMVETAVNSVQTAVYDGITYLFTDDKENWESQTAAMWKNTMSFVAESHVQNAFNSFYQNTKVGQWLDENAFDAFKSDGIVSQVSQGLGYVAGIILTGNVTGIATSAVASVAALGKYTSESWAEDRDSSWQGMIELHEKGQISDEDFEYMQSVRNMGDSEWSSIESLYSSGEITEEQYQMIKQIREMPEEWTTLKNAGQGLAYGSLSALWEGLQWFTGSKLGGWSVSGKPAVTSLVRIAGDTVFNTADTFYRAFSGAITSDKTFTEAFEAQGGVTSVLVNLGVGLLGSAASEVITGASINRKLNSIGSLRQLDEMDSKMATKLRREIFTDLQDGTISMDSISKKSQTLLLKEFNERYPDTFVNGARNLETATQIAEYFNDPRGFLASKFVSGNQPLDDTALYGLYSQLSLEDKNIFATLLANQRVFSQEEQQLINSFSKYTGPVYAAYVRQEDITFDDFLFKGKEGVAVNTSNYEVIPLEEYIGRAERTMFGTDGRIPADVDMASDVAMLDNIINGYTLEENFIVRRNVNNIYENGKKISTFDIGTTFSDSGYMSTSADIGRAFDTKGIKLEIEIPAGSNIGYIEQIAGGRNNYFQQEILLGRNNTYEISDFMSLLDPTGQTSYQAILPVKMLPKE